MTLHDAAIYRFGQWWKRAMRGGYGFAQGAALHGAPPERHAIQETRRGWFWGLGIPLATVCLVSLIGWWGMIALSAYPIQVVRLRTQGGRASARENWLRAAGLVLSKFPEMFGQVKFQLDRLRQAQSRLIEYK